MVAAVVGMGILDMDIHMAFRMAYHKALVAYLVASHMALVAFQVAFVVLHSTLVEQLPLVAFRMDSRMGSRKDNQQMVVMVVVVVLQVQLLVGQLQLLVLQ